MYVYGLATRSVFFFLSIGESVTGTRFLLGLSSVERGTAFHGYNFRYLTRYMETRYIQILDPQALYSKDPNPRQCIVLSGVLGLFPSRFLRVIILRT